MCPKLLLPKNVVTWMRQGSCFRTPFGNQRVKGSKTLLMSPWQHLDDSAPLISNKLSCVSCVLVRPKIELSCVSSDRFLTRWRQIACILLIIDRNSRNKFKRNYLQNHQYFVKILFHFRNLDKILSVLKKRLPS